MDGAALITAAWHAVQPFRPTQTISTEANHDMLPVQDLRIHRCSTFDIELSINSLIMRSADAGLES